jgi:hypothetical protein
VEMLDNDKKLEKLYYLSLDKLFAVFRDAHRNFS